MFRCRKKITALLVAVLLFVLSPMVVAENASLATKSFALGIQQFKQENYSAAVKQFEKARKAGDRSTALYYNLGSAYFKLKQYKSAEKYFLKLKKQSNIKLLAEYNLGLIATKQNKLSKAKKYFESVVKNSHDKKIVYLANQQLYKLKPKPTIKKASANKASVYLSGGLGYDSNINFAPIGTGSEASGRFFDAMVSADYLFAGRHLNGWSAEALLYTIRYGNTSGGLAIPKGTFDQDEYGVSLKKTQKLASWDTHLKMTLSNLTYGARDYQSIIKLEARGRHKLSKTDRIYLRYRYEDINSADASFDYTEGWRQKIRGEFRRYNKNNALQFYYELELNDRNDLRINDPVDGISEFSYSPTRHTLRGKYTTKLNATWDVTGDLSYRKSNYPSTLTQARNDDRWKAIASANYRFDKTMKLKLKLEYTDNASSDNVYVYDRQLVMVSLNKLF